MSNKYRIDFEYTEPMFAEVFVEADTDLKAAVKAKEEFEQLYPEALDAEVVMISELDH
jgi:hypothetical protein